MLADASVDRAEAVAPYVVGLLPVDNNLIDGAGTDEELGRDRHGAGSDLPCSP